jgi:hypothetical protein
LPVLALARRGAARWRWQGETLDEIDIRLFHLIEELPRVSGEIFDVAPLPFGIEQIEDERRFSRAAQAGDDHHLHYEDLQAEVLQIVLACTTNLDNFRSAFSRRLFFSSESRYRGNDRELCRDPTPHGLKT